MSLPKRFIVKKRLFTSRRFIHDLRKCLKRRRASSFDFVTASIAPTLQLFFPPYIPGTQLKNSLA